MWRLANTAIVVTTGAAFAAWVPLDRFVDSLQPTVVALSIMAAGLLVRLNRGMPALDWKSLDPVKRKVLTEQVVELVREYLFVLGLQLIALVSLVTLAALAKPPPLVPTEPWIERSVVGFVGALIAMCLTRMAFIVWRDYDIVRLQKHLIDEAADKEASEQSSKAATEKVNSIKAAGLRGTAAMQSRKE
jgi:hypothetical protein